MLTEIEIEDVGTYRLPNMWQHARIAHMPRPKQATASLAYGMGMTIQQFNRLPVEKRDEVRRAYLKLTSPSNIRAGPMT